MFLTRYDAGKLDNAIFDFEADRRLRSKRRFDELFGAIADAYERRRFGENIRQHEKHHVDLMVIERELCKLHHARLEQFELVTVERRNLPNAKDLFARRKSLKVLIKYCLVGFALEIAPGRKHLASKDFDVDTGDLCQSQRRRFVDRRTRRRPKQQRIRNNGTT